MEEYVGVEFGERRAVGWVDPKIQKGDDFFRRFLELLQRLDEGDQVLSVSLLLQAGEHHFSA